MIASGQDANKAFMLALTGALRNKKIIQEAGLNPAPTNSKGVDLPDAVWSFDVTFRLELW
jgi:hypothetical protein